MRFARLAVATSTCLLGVLLTTTEAHAQLEPQATDFESEDAPEPVPPTLTRAPELLEREEPAYPAAAAAEGLEGEVVLLLEIDASGTVQHVSVSQSAGDDLDAAAVAAALRFVFQPAEWDGVPGPVAIEYRQVFQLAVPTSLPANTPASQAAADDELAAVAGGGDSGPVNFAGVVREAGSKTPLEGVEVSVVASLASRAGLDAASTRPDGEDAHTMLTDAQGRFAFRGLPVGELRATFALNGYLPETTHESVEAGLRTQLTLYLRPRVTNKFQTVVRVQREQKEVARVALSREEVAKLPGTFGDPLRVIENLPGLARASFGGGALIVRGANPEDSGVYFDGVPIPILYHFGGLKSVVNAEFLDQIAFYPGGFGARYGRATAGIVDVASRDLNMPRFHGAADVSIVDSSFFFGGPVTLSSSLPAVTIAAAARRSYIDALLPVVLDAVVPAGTSILAVPVFWDYQLKAETRPWTGQRVSVFGFGSADDIKVLGGTDDLAINMGVLQSFHRLVLRWTSQLDGGFAHTLQPFVGLDRTSLEVSAGEIDAGATFDTYTWGLRDDLEWKAAPGVLLNAGIDYLGNSSVTEGSFPVPGVTEISGFPRIYSREESANQDFSSAGIVHQLGLYVEGVLEPWRWLKLAPGMRLDLDRLAYSEHLDTDAAWASLFGDAADMPVLSNADPRLSVRLTPLPGGVLKAAIGSYRQPPASGLLSADQGNPALDQPRALQFIAGFEQRLLPQILLDVQLYTTQRDLLIQRTSEEVIDASGESVPLRYDNGGVGTTVGAELLLRHEVQRYSLRWLGDLYRQGLPGLYVGWMDSLFSEVGFFGWIAYTLSRTDIDVDSLSDRRVLTEYDQTHILTIVAQANLPMGFTLGARFRLVSGNPTNAPVGSVHDLDLNRYSAITASAQSRLSTFHQLDLRLDRRFVFDNFSITPYLDVFNVYNQSNAEGYQTDYRSTTQQPIPGLPILPNLGIQGEF